MGKKIVSILLTVVLLVGMFSLTYSVGAEETGSYYVSYTVDLTDDWYNSNGESWFRVYYKNGEKVEYKQFDQEKAFWNVDGDFEGSIKKAVFSGWIDGYPLKIIQYAEIDNFPSFPYLFRSLGYENGTLMAGKSEDAMEVVFSGISYSRTTENSKSEKWHIEFYDVIATDGSIPNITYSPNMFAPGYNFDTDRYHFSNMSEVIPQDIYEDVYGEEKGEILYKKNEIKDGVEKEHGVCYGMAVTTASMWLDAPNPDSFIRVTGACKNIIDINKGTKSISLNGINAKTYIYYGYVTQFAREVIHDYDIEALYNAVYDYVNNGGLPVAIMLEECEYDSQTNSWYCSFGHEVLAVGLDGEYLLVNDSNYPNEIQKIKLCRNQVTGEFTGKWEYPNYSALDNADNYLAEEKAKSNGRFARIRYSTDVILADAVLEFDARLTTDEVAESEDENYEVVAYFKDIDTDSNLLYVDAENFELSSDDENITEIESPCNGEEIVESSNLYWVDNDSYVFVEDIEGGNGTIDFAGNDCTLTVSATDGSDVKLTLDEENDKISADIDSVVGDTYSISVKTTTDDKEEVKLTLQGTATAEKVTAEKTETGMIVSGLSDVNAVYEVDEATTEKKINHVDGGEVSVSVDESSKEISSDADEKHLDTDNDGICDDCSKKLASDEPTQSECDCLCHETGFMGFIYKIIRIFWKLFKTNKTCTCGAVHY